MKDNPFPVDAFHPEFAEYIKNISANDIIDDGIVSTGLLSACGFVLSNAYELHVRPDPYAPWIERSNIWSIIGLNTGMGKSVIQNKIFSPITSFQFKLMEENKKHNALVAEWKAKLKELKIKDETGNFLDNHPELRNWLSNNNLNGPPKYEETVHLYNEEFTFERLGEQLSGNKGHAMTILYDEIYGFFKMFNKYRSGNDEELMLKLWGYQPFKRSLVKGDIMVKNPIVSVFGSTQPELLSNIFTDDRRVNGNIYRFLFSVDLENKPKNPHGTKISYSSEKYFGFMNSYLSYFKGTKNSDKLYLDSGIMGDDGFVYNWKNELQNKLVVEESIIDQGTFNRIMGKIDEYVYRIAIILNRINAYMLNDNNDVLIKKDEVENSAKIVEYYVREIIAIIYSTDLTYKKFLRGPSEINFYENIIQESSQYGTIIKQLETSLHYSPTKAKNTLAKWMDNKIVKKNAKGYYYKSIPN